MIGCTCRVCKLETANYTVNLINCKTEHELKYCPWCAGPLKELQPAGGKETLDYFVANNMYVGSLLTMEWINGKQIVKIRTSNRALVEAEFECGCDKVYRKVK